MKNYLRIAVLAGGASLLAASPVFAQGLNALNPLAGLGLDLDPFHIFTPAAPPPAPGGAEGPAPRSHHHRRLHHAAARHHHAHYAAAHHASHHVAARHTAHTAHLAKS